MVIRSQTARYAGAPHTAKRCLARAGIQAISFEGTSLQPIRANGSGRWLVVQVLLAGRRHVILNVITESSAPVSSALSIVARGSFSATTRIIARSESHKIYPWLPPTDLIDMWIYRVLRECQSPHPKKILNAIIMSKKLQFLGNYSCR